MNQKLQKLLILSAVCLTLATGANAQTTCWGTEVAGNNGHVYCRSNNGQEMDWYSAYAWCDAQGRHMPTANELCDIGTVVWGNNMNVSCTNIGYYIHNVWTSTLNENGDVYYHKQYNLPSMETTSDKLERKVAVCY